MRHLIFAILFFFIISQAYASDDVFHAPETRAEKALDALFKQISDKNLPDEALSEAFLKEWGNRSDISDLFCRGHLTGNILTYTTLEDDGNKAIISYESREPDDWYGFGEYRSHYRMLKINNQWKLDGIGCDQHFNINMPEYSENFCSQSYLSQGDVKGCRITEIDNVWDKLLNLRKEIRKTLENYPEKLKSFNEMEKAWITYVNAEIDFMYVEKDGSWVIRPCGLNIPEGYMKDRIKQLERWLEDNSSKENICQAPLE